MIKRVIIMTKHEFKERQTRRVMRREAAGAPQRDRGFPKVLQPKQGLEMSPGFWEPVLS